MMKETGSKKLEMTAGEICPLISSHCRRRCVSGLSEEKCLDGSYNGCETYQVVVVRGVNYWFGGFKR